jgi:hypothetical protein
MLLNISSCMSGYLQIFCHIFLLQFTFCVQPIYNISQTHFVSFYYLHSYSDMLVGGVPLVLIEIE